MNIPALKAELDSGHPDTGAYSANAETAAAELNFPNRTKNKTSLTGDEMFDATVVADWALLTDHQQQLWISFTSKDSINPFGVANVAFVTNLFGAGSDTLTALAALRKEDVSRAVELGLGAVKAGEVIEARSYGA